MRAVAKLLVLVTCAMASVTTAHAQASPDCLVPGIRDVPAMPAHLDQADIVSGKVPLGDVIADGLTLMITNFNRCDGRGRPAATGNFLPEQRPLPWNFMRYSGDCAPFPPLQPHRRAVARPVRRRLADPSEPIHHARLLRRNGP